MKVLLVNGSPHEKGCTYTALHLVAKTLNEQGIDTEIFWIGAQPVGGCVDCNVCRKTGQCAFDGPVNQLLEKAKEADGFVFGSPVHFAGISGSMKGLLDRAFMAGSKYFVQKPAALLVSARRAGTTASLDEFNKYPGIAQMPLVSSCYWPMVHGQHPEDVLQDAEGYAVMEQMGKNMAWILQCIQLGKENGLTPPACPPRPKTNFIR